MKITNIKSPFNNFIIFFMLLLFINSCGIYKRSDVKDNPINEKDKREKNINEGRGINLFKGKKSGQFDFATSNEMWRATFEILDFVPLSNVDYGGGIIITDWYSESNDGRESIKISVQFLSNEIRVDGLKIQIFSKKCNVEQACKTEKIESKLNTEIKLAILKKAAQIKKGDFKKSREGKQPYESGGILK
tara:strand:+ start:1294 stop:1863 length:570 start_codon:yes stop_codon:yes gene_type:complete